MADADLQLLLDPGPTGRGIRLERRVDVGTKSHYYCVPAVTLAGHARWVEVTTSDNDATKDTAIRAALA
jgi:hypothetical protein